MNSSATLLSSSGSAGALVSLEGYLLKQGASQYSAYRRRYFRLESGNTLCYYEGKSELYHELGVIQLANVTAIRAADEPRSVQGFKFHLETEKRVWNFIAGSEQEAWRWIEGLTFAKACLDARGNLNRSSHMSLDQEKSMQSKLERARSDVAEERARAARQQARVVELEHRVRILEAENERLRTGAELAASSSARARELESAQELNQRLLATVADQRTQLQVEVSRVHRLALCNEKMFRQLSDRAPHDESIDLSAVPWSCCHAEGGSVTRSSGEVNVQGRMGPLPTLIDLDEHRHVWQCREGSGEKCAVDEWFEKDRELSQRASLAAHLHSAPPHVDDSDSAGRNSPSAARCGTCQRAFTPFRWKHRCHACAALSLAAVFCSDCSVMKKYACELSAPMFLTIPIPQWSSSLS